MSDWESVPLRNRRQFRTILVGLFSSREADTRIVMADTDGMLLNFSVSDLPAIAKPNVKAGRWQDRQAAKRTSRSGPNAVTPTTNGVGPGLNSRPHQDEHHADADSTSKRPAKRQRVGEFKPASTRAAAASTTAAAANKIVDRSGGREVISSLFSSNPTSQTATDKQGDDTESQEATNAPLIDGLDTFTTLGLTTSLSTHLLTKMELKAPTAIQRATIPELIKDDADAFIQAETGSGKTLAYLLPIVQRITGIKRQAATSDIGDGKIHRDSGLFAIILAPTRELCKQISVVLDNLLRSAHWIVAGTVIGGEKKKSEKARLRKGLNILVATPGRLADHLDNTEVLDVRSVRWLVLDEGDRLMELGFEEEIKGIVGKLEERGRLSRTAGQHTSSSLPDRRITILCSATMKMNVQRLGEISLKDAVHLKAEPGEKGSTSEDSKASGDIFSAPAQLKQSYAVVPAKLRMVTLAAVLKRAFSRKGSVTKAIVFITCADSVDFHFDLFCHPDGMPTSDAMSSSAGGLTSSKLGGKVKSAASAASRAPSINTITSLASPLLTTHATHPVTLHRLHGTLHQPVRTATLRAFSTSLTPSILLCTDIASRGLDLPSVDLILEYDPPCSLSEHLHRIGRTARAGRDGRAMIFLLPGAEESYVPLLKSATHDCGRGVIRHTAEELLKKGFTPSNPNARSNWEESATELQLGMERWVVTSERMADLARKAFQSSIRAYATHEKSERHIFNLQEVHLGHLAKSFALRERPGGMGSGPGRSSGRSRNAVDTGGRSNSDKVSARVASGPGKNAGMDDVREVNTEEAARRMRMKMKEHMGGISEFNLG